jgi:hypothetical protein
MFTHTDFEIPLTQLWLETASEVWENIYDQGLKIGSSLNAQWQGIIELVIGQSFDGVLCSHSKWCSLKVSVAWGHTIYHKWEKHAAVTTIEQIACVCTHRNLLRIQKEMHKKYP